MASELYLDDLVPPPRALRTPPPPPSPDATLNLRGHRPLPGGLVRAPRGPRPGSERAAAPPAPLPLHDLTPERAPRAPGPDATPAEARAPAPEARAPEARAPEHRFFETLAGPAELLAGLAGTTYALGWFAELMLAHFYRAPGGPAQHVMVTLAGGIALLSALGVLNLAVFDLTGRRSLLLGTMLAGPLALATLAPAQDALTVFAHHLQGGPGPHPTALVYEPSAPSPKIVP